MSTKKDFKLFHAKIGEWQERYIALQLEDYKAILEKPQNPSATFHELEKRMKEDRTKYGVSFKGIRPSELTVTLMIMLKEGSISFEDLEDFSEELKDTIRKFMESRGI